MGDEGATGWATWESKQGMGLHSPAPNGTSAGGTATTHRQEEEEKGGWGEWVPLMPDTPMEPKAAPEQEAEAEAAADEVRPPAMSYHMGIFTCPRLPATPCMTNEACTGSSLEVFCQYISINT